MPIVINQKGNLAKTNKFLERAKHIIKRSVFDKYGKQGVEALRKSTPKDTGETANSWSYNVDITTSGATIYWTNSHIDNGVHIAIILQYGHGTGTGGYVQGIDYINPALRTIFTDMADGLWEEVTKN